MTNYRPISELLPHKAPMILIDKLVTISEDSVQCQVKIAPSSLFFDAQLAAIPAWVGIEFMAQTISAWSGFHAAENGQAPSIGFLLGTRQYHAHCSEFANGLVLDIYAQQIMENEGMAAFACSIKHEATELASCQLNVFVPKQEKLQDMLGNESKKESQ